MGKNYVFEGEQIVLALSEIKYIEKEYSYSDSGRYHIGCTVHTFSGAVFVGKKDSERLIIAYMSFKNDMYEEEFTNAVIEDTCVKIIEYEGKDKFGNPLLQQIADAYYNYVQSKFIQKEQRNE